MCVCVFFFVFFFWERGGEVFILCVFGLFFEGCLVFREWREGSCLFGRRRGEGSGSRGCWGRGGRNGSGVCVCVPEERSAGSGLGKFNSNNVTIQPSKVGMSILEAGELWVVYNCYKAVFGVFPLAEEEPTVEQLTAVQKVLEGDICPHVDFAVCVPDGNRMMRKLKLQGTTFSSGGSILPIEVIGPPNIVCWSKSYACLRTAMITVGHARKHDQAVRFPVMSLQFYQAESRCRSGRVERVRRLH